jgi:hypothetical protein
MKNLLHVGCGGKSIDQTTPGFALGGWKEVRFDIDPSAKPDLIGTMTNMASVDSGTMDALFSSHNVEHLYPHEVPLAFAEFRRVLKDDGFAVITCPDLQSVARLVAEDKLTEIAYHSPGGPITPLDILFGHGASLYRGNLYMAHHVGFTRKVLHATLEAAGFPSVASLARGYAPYFDLWALASRSTRSDDDLRALAAQHFPLDAEASRPAAS